MKLSKKDIKALSGLVGAVIPEVKENSKQNAALMLKLSDTLKANMKRTGTTENSISMSALKQMLEGIYWRFKVDWTGDDVSYGKVFAKAFAGPLAKLRDAKQGIVAPGVGTLVRKPSKPRVPKPAVAKQVGAKQDSPHVEIITEIVDALRLYQANRIDVEILDIMIRKIERKYNIAGLSHIGVLEHVDEYLKAGKLMDEFTAKYSGKPYPEEELNKLLDKLSLEHFFSNVRFLGGKVTPDAAVDANIAEAQKMQNIHSQLEEIAKDLSGLPEVLLQFAGGRPFSVITPHAKITDDNFFKVFSRQGNDTLIPMAEINLVEDPIVEVVELAGGDFIIETRHGVVLTILHPVTKPVQSLVGGFTTGVMPDEIMEVL